MNDGFTLGPSSPPVQRRPVPVNPFWKGALPYFGTLVIFVLIFWRIPIAKVAQALEHVPIVKFFGVFLPFCVFYWIVDSLCLTWVVGRFNAALRLRDIMPIRASMYLLSLINSNLGQGGVAWYLHRKTAVPFLEMLSSILFIALMEIYQLFLFSTLGVIVYRPNSPAQLEIVRVLRVAYVIAWIMLGTLIAFFAYARRSSRARDWITRGKARAMTRTFMAAGFLDYVIVLGIKAPSFMLSVITQYLALSLYGIHIPFAQLVLFLPLVFLAAALPISVAHLGTSQAAWLLFFSGSAPPAKILAYSLAAHFTFMFCNALIGLFYLPRASRELTTLGTTAAGDD